MRDAELDARFAAAVRAIVAEAPPAPTTTDIETRIATRGRRSIRAAHVLVAAVLLALMVGATTWVLVDHTDHPARVGTGNDGPPAEPLPPSSTITTPTTTTVGAPAAACDPLTLLPDPVGSELATPVWETLPPGPVDGHFEASAVWTGREVIVWGGEDGGDGPVLATGAAFDPVAGTWRSIADAPIAPRSAHVAVWTGTEMVIWGGGEGGHHPPDAGAYDPQTDTWRVIPTAPIGSLGNAQGFWTGTEVLIVGGFRDGVIPITAAAAYNPCANTWRMLPPFPIEGARRVPATAWTGSEAIIWGGNDYNNIALTDGAAFDPQTSQWRLLPPLDVYVGYYGPDGAWTGSEFLVWGWPNGAPERAVNNRTIAWNPESNTWRHLAPAPLVPHADEVEGTIGGPVIWAGDRLVIWSGYLDAEGPLPLTFDPDTNQWRRLTPPPEIGNGFAPLVWTGAELFLPGAGPDGRSLLLRMRQR